MLNFNIFINYLIIETKFLLRNASERNYKGRQNESKVTKDKSAVARRCTKGNIGLKLYASVGKEDVGSEENNGKHC